MAELRLDNNRFTGTLCGGIPARHGAVTQPTRFRVPIVNLSMQGCLQSNTLFGDHGYQVITLPTTVAVSGSHFHTEHKLSKD